MCGPLIRIVELRKTYRLGGADVHALYNLSLEINIGEIVAIMGPSGCGKSTLINLIGFLDRPTSGRYFFEGEDVSGLDADARASIRSRKVGFVFQNFNLLSRSTAFQNVELPLIYAGVAATERQERATDALAAVELTHRATHWPHQLSGGEQQRVTIARAIVNNPALLLADEPTGSLDSRTGLEILALFQALNSSGRTIVLVTHDPRVARHARRIVTLQDGVGVADEHLQQPLDAHAALAKTSRGDSKRAEDEVATK